MNSRHPETPARGKAGSEPQLLTPFPVDPLDPLDPAENSKNAIFAERVVIFGPCGVPGPPLGPHGSPGGSAGLP